MKKMLMNKNFITIIGIIVALMILFVCTTGCNKQIIDLDYSYKKIRCNYDGIKIELDIDKWKDYEGEQIQVKAKNGKTYLFTTNKCFLES